ncbi:S41 family peptidase [Frigoriglobus tundricola]|uniref:Carboxyl-terminal protease n=1 Tax=Frigoriglobus tundricola TaxID=2774151 RepID=A0A6M5YTD0_9BACT|nr:S41 family peptidase [Frigoriglobus tundricola]QJW96583.1 Carboxyl-terminal protease [Frigoriglobus tundricola]
MPLRNLAWLLIVPALVALGLAISYSAPPPDKDYNRVRQIVDVLAEVDAHFYRKLDDKEQQQLVEDMINGGLHKLDPHSEYLNPAQLKQFESDSEGSFGGVGIILAIDSSTKFLKVDHPMPGTPAYEAGVLAGDLIVKVDGKSTEGLTVPEARKLITGEQGSKVLVTIRRAGRNPADEEVELTRGRITQHPVTGVRRRADDPNRWEWFVDRPNGIALVRVSGFNEQTTKELKAALAEIEGEGGKALILDLRDNPGGLLNQAIDVANLFLPEGAPIVSTRGRDAERERAFKAEKDREVFKPADRHPVVVLVNDGSASASEIVASALQDNKRAVVMGERSYGKGSVQKLLRLQVAGDKAAVKLTTETYWRPNGENMDKRLAPKDKPDEWGVKPNIVVPMTYEERERAAWDYYRSTWVAGKPSALGPNPPAAPAPPAPGSLALALRTQISPTAPPMPDTKVVEDKQLKAAVEELKKKLGGVGTAPRQPARAPELIVG